MGMKRLLTQLNSYSQISSQIQAYEASNVRSNKLSDIVWLGVVYSTIKKSKIPLTAYKIASKASVKTTKNFYWVVLSTKFPKIIKLTPNVIWLTW